MVSYSLKLLDTLTQKQSNSKSNNLLKLPETNKKKPLIKLDGILYGQFTNQNTIFTLTDLKGKVKTTLSNGMVGYKNSKSKTRFGTQAAAERISQKAKALGFYFITFIMKGKNKGRRKCVLTLQKSGLTIKNIFDQTPTIHNGCRPKKEKRTKAKTSSHK